MNNLLADTQLLLSDFNMARITEDLIDVLLQKGVITLNDFPEVARDKLAQRKLVRDKISEFK